MTVPVCVVSALVLLAGCGSSDGGKQSPARAVAGVNVAAAVVRDDKEAGASFAAAKRPTDGPKAPTPGSLQAAKASRSPAASADDGVSPGAPSDEEIKRELKAMGKALDEQRRALKSSAGTATLDADGSAEPPPGAPIQVARMIAGGNAIAKYPYVYGGGHGSFVDSAYDCSGSVSYALAAAGLLKAPMTSGELAKWGEPGQGRYVTIFANEGHVFMYVNGLRFDTSFRAGPLGTRWQTSRRSLRGFVMRHPPGL